MTTMMHTNLNLSIDSCRAEVRKEARERGDRLTFDDEFSKAHALLSMRMAAVRERAIALLRENASLGLRRPVASEAADLDSVLSAEVERAIADGANLVDAIDAVRDAVESALTKVETKKAQTHKPKAMAKPAAPTTEATTASDDQGDGADMAAKAACKDVGETARALMASDKSLSWDTAILAAHAQTSPVPAYPMRGTSVRTRREVQAAKGGAR